jgi:hypothetical protein
MDGKRYLWGFEKDPMRNLLQVTLLLLMLWRSQNTNAQSYTQTYQKATFLMADSSENSASVNVKLLLIKNTLEFEQPPARLWKLTDAYAIIIDSTKYFVKKINNIDTSKVVEQVIEGRISMYRSPRITSKEELFIERDNKVYELRYVTRLLQEGTFTFKEYVSYLKFVTRDCVGPTNLDELDLSLSKIYNFVSSYNARCGWQKTQSAHKELKPKITTGIVAGVMGIRHQLNYEYGPTYKGKSFLFGLFVGPSVDIEFRKFFDTHVSFNLLLEGISGNGRASASRRQDQLHHYEIIQLKHFFTFNFSIYSEESKNVFVGIGSVLHQQLLNHTTVASAKSRLNPTYFESRKDRINLSPVAHINFVVDRLGFRYQVIPLSIQMKTIEVFGIEHRISVQYDLSK